MSGQHQYETYFLSQWFVLRHPWVDILGSAIHRTESTSIYISTAKVSRLSSGLDGTCTLNTGKKFRVNTISAVKTISMWLLSADQECRRQPPDNSVLLTIFLTRARTLSSATISDPPSSHPQFLALAAEVAPTEHASIRT